MCFPYGQRRKIDLFLSHRHHHQHRHYAVKRVKMNFSNLKLNRDRNDKNKKRYETNDDSKMGMSARMRCWGEEGGGVYSG